jgi:RNA polymerase sigma-70 factor (ECF subfamily)
MTFAQHELVAEMNNLKSFAHKLCRSRADAEDLLQATILRALEKRTQFQTGTNLFSWTSKIMFNLFATAYRRRTKYETQYDCEELLKNQSVEPAQETELEMKQLGAAMKRLSDDHRTVLLMVCVQGMAYEDVSAALDIPVGTVRSRLSRAREQLKSLLETGSFGDGVTAVPAHQISSRRKLAKAA